MAWIAPERAELIVDFQQFIHAVGAGVPRADGRHSMAGQRVAGGFASRKKTQHLGHFIAITSTK